MLKHVFAWEVDNKIEDSLSYQPEFKEYRYAIGTRSYEKHSGAIKDA